MTTQPQSVVCKWIRRSSDTINSVTNRLLVHFLFFTLHYPSKSLELRKALSWLLWRLTARWHCNPGFKMQQQLDNSPAWGGAAFVPQQWQTWGAKRETTQIILWHKISATPGEEGGGGVSLCIKEGVKGGKRTPPTLQHSPASSTAAFNIHLRCTRFVLEVANNGGSNKLQSGVKRKRQTMVLSWEKKMRKKEYN